MSDVPGGPTPPTPPPPPPMMGGPQGSIPPKTVGDILSAAFNIYKANASQLILVVAVVVIPLSLIAALFSGVVFAPERIRVTDAGGVVVLDYAGRSLGIALLLGAIGALIAVLISAILQAAILRAATQATIGDPVDVEASYRYGLKRFGSVILVSLLVGLIVAVGFLLLVVPGIIFLVFLSLSIPVLIVEGRRGTEAMGRSWNLVKGHFWHALGVIVVVALIVGIISGIIGGIGGNNWAVRWIFTAIAQILTVPFASLVSVLLYLDLRARSETLFAETLRRELASGT